MTEKTQLIRLPALRQKLGGVGRTTVYEWMAEKGFPRPLRLSRRAVVWVESEVDAWLAPFMEARSENAAECDAA